MKIFVTGATGFIGSAIVPELIKAGHQVLGLTRSMRRPDLSSRRAEVASRGLEDLEASGRGAELSDGVNPTVPSSRLSNFVAKL